VLSASLSGFTFLRLAYRNRSEMSRLAICLDRYASQLYHLGRHRDSDSRPPDLTRVYCFAGGAFGLHMS
jgi:hypothetical protein